MATKTTTQAGNFSDGATWVGGVKPSTGDDIVAAHDLTINENANLGAGGDETTFAVVINTGVTVTLATGVTLTCRGGISHEGSARFKLNGTAIVEFDGSTYNYEWRVGSTHNAAPAIELAGTDDDNKCQIRTNEGGNNAWISDGTGPWLKAGLIQGIGYCKFTRVGGADNQCIRMSPTGDSTFALKHCEFVDCGRIDGTYNWGGDATIEISDCHQTGTVDVDSEDTCLRVRNASGMGAGTGSWKILRNSFDKTVQFTGPGDIEIEHNIFYGSIITTVDVPWATFKYNFVRISPDGGEFNLGGDTYQNTYFNNDPTNYNPHFVSILTDGSYNQTADGDIFDMDCQQEALDQEGDAYQIDAPGSGSATALIKNTIIVKGPANRTVASLISALGDANVTVQIEHCTVHVGKTGGVRVGETYAGHAGLLDYVKSCIFWDHDGGQGYKISDVSTDDSVSDLIAAADADYNCGYNLLAGSNLKGYHHLEFSSGSPGDHDIVADPQFRDPDRTLATWDASLGGPGTYANALTELAKMNTSDWNTDYNYDAWYAYIQYGFTPLNQTLKDAAHDGGDIGAVPVGLVSGGQSTKMLMLDVG